MNQGITFTINAETQEALQRVQQFADGALSSLSRLSGLAPMLAAIGPQIAAVFSVATVAEFTRETINAAEQLGKLHEKTGLAVTTLNSLRAASEKLGTPWESLQFSLGMFSSKIEQAIRFGGQAAKVFSDLKVKLLDNGAYRSTDAILSDVIQKFATLSDQAKVGVATEMFGRGGRELIPVLNQMGAGGTGEAGGFTEKMVADATQFNTNLRAGIETIKDMGRVMVADILPSLIKLEALGPVIVQSWRNGKLPEMIGLLIEAGFELGTQAGAKALNGIIEEAKAHLGPGSDFWLGVLNAVMSFGVQAAEFLLKVMQAPVTVMAAGFDWLYDQMRVGFQKVANFFQDALRDVFNWFVAEYNRYLAPILRTGSMQPSFGKSEEVEPGKSYAAAYASNSAAAADVVLGVTKYLNQQLDTSRSILGINMQISKVDDQRKTALERLNALLDAQVLKKAATALTGGADANKAPDKALANEEVKKFQEELDKAYSEGAQDRVAIIQQEELKQLDQLETFHKNGLISEQQYQDDRLEIANTAADKIHAIQRKEQDEMNAMGMSWIIGQAALSQKQPNTEAQKADEQLGFLKQQNAELQKSVDITVERAKDDSLSYDEQIANAKEYQKLLLQQASVQQQIGTLQRQNTFAGEFKSAFQAIANEWGSLAKQMADALKSAFNTAVSSISTGITGLIMGTKTWAQALREVANTILTTIVNSIVQMGVRWVLTQIMMAVAGRALAAATTVSLAPIAAAQSAIWAAPATLATISSYGGAAAAAPAQVLLAEAITQASAVAQFAEGGFTGAGGRYEPAGIVHRGEYVFNAPAVGRIGRGNLEALDRGGLVGGGAGDAGVRTNVRVHVVNSHQAALNAMRSDPQAEHSIVDVVGRHAHKIR